MKCVTCQKRIEDCNCACFIYEYEEETEEPERKPIHYLCHYCGVQYQMENNNASTVCCGSQNCEFYIMAFLGRKKNEVEIDISNTVCEEVE